MSDLCHFMSDLCHIMSDFLRKHNRYSCVNIVTSVNIVYVVNTLLAPRLAFSFSVSF
jgi:hypothetical protein